MVVDLISHSQARIGSAHSAQRLADAKDDDGQISRNLKFFVKDHPLNSPTWSEVVCRFLSQLSVLDFAP